MQTERTNIRFSSDVAQWLQIRRKENNRSLNAEILDAIREAMKRDPLLIYVRECIAPDGRFYCVAVSLDGDFFETDDREQAFAVARDKASELGLPRSSVRFESENYAGAVNG